VEEPLFLTEKLIDELEEIRTRMDATMKVWHETERTLRPALSKLEAQLQSLKKQQEKLAILWKQGYDSHWK